MSDQAPDNKQLVADLLWWATQVQGRRALTPWDQGLIRLLQQAASAVRSDQQDGLSRAQVEQIIARWREQAELDYTIAKRAPARSRTRAIHFNLGDNTIVKCDELEAAIRQTGTHPPALQHRCGVRGFAESGDKCPACHAPGGRHAP